MSPIPSRQLPLQHSSKNPMQAKLKPVITGKALNFKVGFQQKIRPRSEGQTC